MEYVGIKAFIETLEKSKQAVKGHKNAPKNLDELAVVIKCNGKHYIPYGAINVKADVGNGKGCCFISIELSDKTIEDALREEMAECQMK